MSVFEYEYPDRPYAGGGQKTEPGAMLKRFLVECKDPEMWVAWIEERAERLALHAVVSARETERENELRERVTREVVDEVTRALSGIGVQR